MEESDESFDEYIEILQANEAVIVADDERFQSEFEELMGKAHDALGRVLKCHLLAEYYMDKQLEFVYGMADLDRARLTFYQKVCLLPKDSPLRVFCRGILFELNRLRNKFGHELHFAATAAQIPLMMKFAKISSRFSGDVIEAVERGTSMCCRAIRVYSPEAEAAYREADKAMKKKRNQ